MAGSKRWFRYRSDAGIDYSVQLDESNSEATCGGVRLMPARTIAHPLMPKGASMRYVYGETLAPTSVAAAATLKTVRRKFWVGDPLASVQILAGQPIVASVYPGVAAVNWSVSSPRGEKFRVAATFNATAGDTGLDDADQGNDQP